MNNWIIPCNLKYYNVFGAFDDLNKLDWKQTNPCVKTGDTVYIYVGAPYSAIIFKCLVTKTDLETVEIDDSKYAIKGEVYETYPRHMELTLIKKYPPDLFQSGILVGHGLKGRVMCPRRMEESVLHYIKSKE